MLSHYPNDYSNMCYYSMMPWSYAGINWPFNPEKPVLQKIVSYQIMFKKTITQVCVTSPLCDLMLVSWPLGPEKKTFLQKIVTYQIIFQAFTHVCVTSPWCLDLLLVSIDLLTLEEKRFTKDRYLSNHVQKTF